MNKVMTLTFVLVLVSMGCVFTGHWFVALLIVGILRLSGKLE